MLKKLLKYDLKSMLKYWWIAAVISVVLSLSGGFCLSVITSEKNVQSFIGIFSIALIISIIGIVAFLIISYALIYVRFYKNFFTDEGYLTFTLPVKRIQLLNSKLISGFAVIFFTTLITICDFLILFGIGGGKVFWEEFSTFIKESFKYLFIEADTYIIIYAVEILTLLLLCTIFSTLLLFVCITISALLVKKAKVIAAIALYYAVNSTLSGFLQISYTYVITTVSEWVLKLPENFKDPIGLLMLFCAIIVFALVCVLLYTFEYYLLDRKLNLS